MELILADLFLKAFILSGILYLVARNEADFQFQKVAMLVGAITLGSVLIEGLLTPKIGFFSLIPSIALFMYMVMKFCWVSWQKAALAMVIFYTVNFLMMLGLSLFVAHMAAQVEAGGGTLMDRRDAEMQDAVKMYQEMMGATANALEAPSAEEALPSPEVQEALRQKMQQIEAEIAAAQTSSVPASAVAWPAPGSSAAEPAAGTVSGQTAEAASALAPLPAPEPEPLAPPPEMSAEQTASRKLLKVGGIMALKGRKVATVNGKMVGEGEIVPVTYQGKTYQWRLSRIGVYDVEWEAAE